jgi:uncharacterized protein with PIN domain
MRRYFKITYFTNTEHESDNVEVIINEKDERDYKKFEKLFLKLQENEIWDYCFKCGKPLRNKNKEWFDIKNNGESFPLCKKCYERGLKNDT